MQNGLASYDDKMQRLQQRAIMEGKRLHDTRSTATVTWMGYDAPQVDETLLGDRSVVSAHLATVGGDALANFYAGINATRTDGVHLTALGHSYGSTTTAYALRHSGTGVDDAVVFGSPGITTGHLDRLHVPKNHFYAVKAPRDPIADLPRFGGWEADLVPGIKDLSADAYAPRHTVGVSGHTHYLDENSTSQMNIALVTIGHGDKTVRNTRIDHPLTAEPALPRL